MAITTNFQRMCNYTNQAVCTQQLYRLPGNIPSKNREAFIILNKPEWLHELPFKIDEPLANGKPHGSPGFLDS